LKEPWYCVHVKYSPDYLLACNEGKFDLDWLKCV